MTTTADWLHLKLGTPLPDQSVSDLGMDREKEENAGEVIARQRALASQLLSVVFTGR